MSVERNMDCAVPERSTRIFAGEGQQQKVPGL